MNPTGIDTLAAVLTLIIVVVSILTLLGMGVLMAAGAVFSNRPLVTSWPSDQEHAFAPYERKSATLGSQAWVVSFIGAAVVAIFAAGVYFGVAPELTDDTKGMNMSNLTKRRPSTPPPAKTEAAPKAESAPAETPDPAPSAPPATKE